MTTALKEAPAPVTDLEPEPLDEARIRWALHCRMVDEDYSLSAAEKAWFKDPTVVNATQIAEMLDMWRGDGETEERVPYGDRIHEMRHRNDLRPKPHPQTWLDYDFMGVGRRNIPGWYVGRVRYYVWLRGTHVFDPAECRLFTGMLTANLATGLFEIVKGAPRHGRPRRFRANLSQQRGRTDPE